MRAILQKRALRFVFGANMISMLGSGMNSAAVAWYILQATHSEMALGMFAVLQTIPAMLMLPFTGVLIDREDRRRLVMMLDSIRAVIIATVAVLAFAHRVKVWELYLMNTLVSAGFWMFWPTITALIQELTPGEEFVHANTFLLAGVQRRMALAGIGGRLRTTRSASAVCWSWTSELVVCSCVTSQYAVERHVVPRPAELRADIVAAETALERFVRGARRFPVSSPARRSLIYAGLVGALSGANAYGVIVTARALVIKSSTPEPSAIDGSMRATGIGAFISALVYTPSMIAQIGSQRQPWP